MEKTRVLIIGGGILGATTSYYLAKQGYAVTVLEKNELASGASGANLGQISIIDRDEPWHLKLALESLTIYENLNRETPIAYKQSGGTVVLINEEQVEAAKLMAAYLAAYGIEISFYQGKDMLRIEPFLDYTKVQSLAYCALEGKIDPLAATLTFFSKAKELGVEIFTNTCVDSFEVENGKITKAIAKEKEYFADIFINATGAWAGGIGELLCLKIPICYHRGTAFVSQPIASVINGPVVGGGFILKSRLASEKLRIGLAAVQNTNGSIIIAQATEESEVDSKEITAQGLTLTAEKFITYFPALAELEIVRAWSAVTPYTKDGLPIFGFTKSIQNFFVVAGFKGAFSTAPAVGKAVARAIKTGIAYENNSFSPDREMLES
ncbi:MAG: FAD-dependent oxidoreductase [Clostridia bacterium]